MALFKQDMRMRHHIDAWKGCSATFIVSLVFLTRQWNNPAATALALAFSTYSSLWITKSCVFPDKQWENTIPLGTALGVIWLPLCLYLVAPAIMMSRGATLPPWAAALFLCSFIWGVFLHFVGDAHKHFVLKARPGLVQDGVWSLSRNVNYLGELLIYGAFVGIPAAALRSVLPLVPLLISVTTVWVPNMRRKDKSLARHPEFAAWSKKTAFWLPYIW